MQLKRFLKLLNRETFKLNFEKLETLIWHLNQN